MLVQMAAADASARDMLRQNMDQLRQQLADAGLNATSLDVDDGSTWQDPRDRQATADNQGIKFHPATPSPDHKAPGRPSG